MAISDTLVRRVPGVAEQRATRVVFFIVGFAFSAWAALVPFAKARAGLSDGALGLLLLCLGIGSIVAMPVAGASTARFGCRRVMVVATLAAAAALPFLATLSALPALVAALVLLGAGLGAMDVAMNIQAIIVERGSGRSMMSGFHGLFSLGGIAGAGGMAALLSAGASPLAAVLCVSLGIAAALAVSARHLLPYGARSEGPAFAVPRGIVLLIGALAFVLFLAEGAVLDWSAVFLTSVRHMDASYAGLGYAAFAVTMTAGRLAGDRIVDRLGPRRVVLAGSLCAAAGFVAAVGGPCWAAPRLGYALVGGGWAAGPRAPAAGPGGGRGGWGGPAAGAPRPAAAPGGRRRPGKRRCWATPWSASAARTSSRCCSAPPGGRASCRRTWRCPRSPPSATPASSPARRASASSPT